MAYFKPRRNEQGFTRKKRLPSAPEGSSIGGASLYDSFIESIWRSTLDEYTKKRIGWKEAIPYPDKEVWWDDPRSRLELSREYHKYYSEEDIETERILEEEIDAMEKSFFELLLNSPTPRRQWFWDAKRKGRGEGERIGGGGRA